MMLYDIAFLIFSIVYLPTLLLKGKLHGKFGERFARYDAATRARLAAPGEAIWIQAVSVGEVALCKGLIASLRSEYPGTRIVLSTITRTGHDLAVRLFKDEAVVIYFPLDFSGVVKRAIALIRPRLYVMIETEIWPNVLKALVRNAVPAVLVNGRISDRSIGKYRLVKPFLRKTLGRVRFFCMQSATDADRIIELGAPRDRVRVTGTMKFDAVVATDIDAAAIRRSLGLADGDLLYVAGSTHPGEEEALLGAYGELVKEFPSLRLLIAPRHVERAVSVCAAANAAGRRAMLFTDPALAAERAGVIVLDVIGRLAALYAAADLVFVGGSLVQHGGQNPIEPAVFGKAVIFGPHMFNFREVAKVLVDAHGAVQVGTAAELLVRSAALLKDASLRTALGRAAAAAVAANRGASGRNLAALREVL